MRTLCLSLILATIIGCAGTKTETKTGFSLATTNQAGKPESTTASVNLEVTRK